MTGDRELISVPMYLVSLPLLIYLPGFGLGDSALITIPNHFPEAPLLNTTVRLIFHPSLPPHGDEVQHVEPWGTHSSHIQTTASQICQEGKWKKLK